MKDFITVNLLNGGEIVVPIKNLIIEKLVLATEFQYKIIISARDSRDISSDTYDKIKKILSDIEPTKEIVPLSSNRPVIPTPKFRTR